MPGPRDGTLREGGGRKSDQRFIPSSKVRLNVLRSGSAIYQAHENGIMDMA